MARKTTAGTAEKARGSERRPKNTEKQTEEILARARQTVKAIINREAADEIVSDDLLNFRMK